MYVQNLSSIIPTQADQNTVRAKYPGLKDTNVSGTLTNQIDRMLDNIDILAGPGSAKTLLDGFGVAKSGIASLDPDTRTRLAEKVTNRYMSAIKEAAGDTSGSFADVYGNVMGASQSPAPAGSGALPPPGPGAQDRTAEASSAGAVGALADILMRSVAYRDDETARGTTASGDSTPDASRKTEGS